MCRFAPVADRFAMSDFPVVSGPRPQQALAKIGYVKVRQRGDHVRMKCASPGRAPVTVPLHRELRRGTLRSMVGQGGLTLEEFAKLL